MNKEARSVSVQNGDISILKNVLFELPSQNGLRKIQRGGAFRKEKHDLPGFARSTAANVGGRQNCEY